ncbi:WD40 repeat-like protein [Suillus brevipes Sb2]|nr:WD40 repeat-like protein [Suillus brevipes Sb2]
MEPSLSPIRSLRGHADWVYSAVFSKNGNILKIISTSDDKTVRIWDVDTGEQENSFEGHASPTFGLVVSMDGRRCVSGAKDGKIIIWDADTKEIIRCLSHHTDWVNSIQFSPDENRLASASDDGTLKIWDAVWRSEVERDLTGESTTSSLWNRTETLVCWGTRLYTHRARRHSLVVPGPVALRSHLPFFLLCLSIGTFGRRRVSRLQHADTGELVFDIDDHQGLVFTVAYSPNGTKIASGSKDCTVRIWNATTGKQQTQPLIHDSPVNSLVWSSDSRRLISGCVDGQIYFWSAPTGAQLGSPLRAHPENIQLLAISPDGELIASASTDHTARLWSTSTRKPFGRVLQHAKMVITIAFSPDGQLIATGGEENTIFLWDVSQESTIMAHAVSPSFISPASNITSYIDQPPESSHSLPASSELPSETADLRDAATSPSPSLPPQGHSNRDMPSPVRISPSVEFTDGFQVPPEAINSRDAAASPSPSFPSQGSSHPHVTAASASTPALSSPLKSVWSRFPILNRPRASVNSKRWKFPRIGTIMLRKHRNVEPQAGPNDAQH